MPNRKISELTLATSSLPTDGLVIQRGGTNFKLEASNFSTDTGDTGSLVITSSISGTTITFTKGDGSTYTNEIVSASYAITSSHEVVHEESSSYAETSSYAVSASLAQLALEAISSSYAISASHAEVSDEAISASYAITASHATSTAGTLSNGTSVDAFTFDGSTDVTVDISTYSASVSTDRTALSASLTTTDQTISSSVATLSGSASDARNLIAGDLDTLSASFNERINDNDDDIAGLNIYTASLKEAISVTGPDITLLGDLTVQGTQSIIHSTEVSIDDNILSLNGTGAAKGGIEVNDPSGPLSGSLLWDADNDRWIAGPSGSESVLLTADGMGILSSSAQIADEISGSFTEASASLSSSIADLSGSASDARNRLTTDYIAADTTLSASLTTTDQTISSSVAALSASAVLARNNLSLDFVNIDGDTMTDTLVISKSGVSVSDSDLPLGIQGTGLIIGDRAGAGQTFTNGTRVQFRDYGQAHWMIQNSASAFTIEQNSGGGNDGAYITLTQVGKDVTFAGKLRGVSDPIGPQDVVTKAYLGTTTGSFVTSVNGNSPDGTGNVTVALASTSTGLSSSFPGSPDDADVYIISGETATDRTASNGEIFIYSTASSQWYQITSPDQTANDERYVLVSGDTMTGPLVVEDDSATNPAINISNDTDLPTLGFLIPGTAQSELRMETTNPFALKYVSSDGATLRNIKGATPTDNDHLTTKAYVDARGTTGTNGQTIRFNGTTPTANSFLFNNGSQIGIGTTTPKAPLHVDSELKVGSSTLDRDYLQIVVTGISGSIINPNEHLVLHASGSGTSKLELKSDAGDIELNAGSNINAKTNKITNVVDPTAAQDAATKNYVDGRTSVMQFQKTNIQTTSGRTTISFASTPLFTTGISFGTMATTGVFTFSVAGTYRVDIATNTSGTHDDWGLVNNTGTRYLQYAGSGATKYSIGGDFITVSVGDNFRYTAGGGQTWNGNNTQVTTRIAFTRVSS